MSLFQCQQCGVIENTALCFVHSRRFERKVPSDLCSLCDPEIGKWHDRFERKVYPVGTMQTNEVGNIEEIKP